VLSNEIIYDMSDEDYFEIDALNASVLKKMNNPERAKWDDEHKSTSEAMQFGSDFHDFVLRGIRPDQKSDIAISHFDSFRTKEAKAWRDSMLAAGKRVMSSKAVDEMGEYCDDLACMAEAAYALPEFMQNYDESKKEVVLLWEYATASGRVVDCKAKLDLFNPNLSASHIYDLKSCADLGMFKQDVIKYSYYISAAWYTMAVKESIGVDRGFRFAAVGKLRPYQSMVVECSDDLLALGRAECDVLAETWAQCREAGRWPSPYGRNVEVVEVPHWLKKEKGLL